MWPKIQFDPIIELIFGQSVLWVRIIRNISDPKYVFIVIFTLLTVCTRHK